MTPAANDIIQAAWRYRNDMVRDTAREPETYEVTRYERRILIRECPFPSGPLVAYPGRIDTLFGMRIVELPR